MKPKQPSIPDTFRLTVENSQKLSDLKNQTGYSKNEVINRIIAAATVSQIEGEV
jgi:predicted DNA-binding protein